MNYYERHLGDYARDAGHLSMLEHGAYSLLLDRYYTTEQGIPADQAHRVCRARTRDEREAVDTVLAEFFTLVDGLWVNGRAERETTKMQAKVKAAQENGKRGGRPKRTEKEPTGNPPGFELVTQQKALQSPDTSNQEPPSGVEGGKPPKPPLVLPDWIPAEQWEEFVAMRRAKGRRTPFTLAAAKGIVSELTKLREAGQEPAAVLSQSTRNGWSDVFVVKKTDPAVAEQRSFV